MAFLYPGFRALIEKPPPPIIVNADSFDFDGVNDYGYVADADDFTPNNGSTDVPFSIAFWVKPKPGYPFAYCLNKRSAYHLAEWGLVINPTSGVWFTLIDISVGNAGDTRMNVNGGTITTNAWNHIVATYDGNALNTGMEIYINGSIVASPNRTNNGGTYGMVQNTSSRVEAGRYATYYAPILIDEMYIWKGAELSAAEVYSIYSRYDTGISPNLLENYDAYTSAASLVGGWTKNNGSGDFADVTANARTMTRFGGAISSDIPPPP